MKFIHLLRTAALGTLFLAGANTHANPLTARAYATDFPAGNEPYNVLVVQATPLSAGQLDAFQTYDQVLPGGSPTGSAGHQFIGYILRPTGVNQYNVVYDTGVLTVPVVGSDQIISYPASFAVQAGDLLAHFGGGIPVDVGGGTDQLFFPTVGPAPTTGNALTLPDGNFPLYSQDRTYSIAVSYSAPDGGSTVALLASGIALLGAVRRKLA